MTTVSDRLKSLFARTKRAPDLSPSVVRHQRIDEIVRDDLADASGRFRNTLNRVPSIEVDGAPQDYDPAPDLWSDLFMAHYTPGDHVEIKGEGEVAPSRGLHSRIMEHYVNHPDFAKTRAATRSDDMSSGIVTIAAQAKVEAELGDTLRDHAERAREMQQHEDTMRESEERLRALRERAQREHEQTGVTDATKDAIREEASAKGIARGALEKLIVEQDESGFGIDVAGAIDDAMKEAADYAATWSALPGSARGDAARMNPDAAFDLATKWKDNHQLREVAKIIGSFERDFRFSRSNRVQGGREEIVDVTLGADLDLILPTEVMKLGHPILRLQFFKQFVDRTLLQYDTIGENPSGDGPIIACRDCSSSMAGQEMIFASAVDLALLSVATRERRSFANIDFNAHLRDVHVFRKNRPVDAQAVTDIAGTAASGGTDITKAVAKAEEIMLGDGEFRTADIVVITDGADKWQDDDEVLYKRLAERGVRVHAITIGLAETPYTNRAAELTSGTAVGIFDLTGPSDETKRIVQAIS